MQRALITMIGTQGAENKMKETKKKGILTKTKVVK